MIRMSMGMIPMMLNQIIMWNGGQPFPYYENIIYPALVNDLSHLIEGLPVGLKAPAVAKAFLQPLPEGWTFKSENNFSPRIHLTYSGRALEGTAVAGQEIDVFICIASSKKDRHKLSSSLRAVYFRDMPFELDTLSGTRATTASDYEDECNDDSDEQKSKRFDEPPLNRLAAWFTLLTYGVEEIGCNWKKSHTVKGRLTLEGEVPYGELN